jgi:ornithine cyclodeaminase/alanine dehydrogenase-like protein (mu-crystallin family)
MHDHHYIHLFFRLSMQFFSKDDVAARLPYGPLMNALAHGLQQPITSPARSHFQPNGDASAVLVMAAWKPHAIMGVKLVSIWPGNNAKGMPAVAGVYVVMSCVDGTPLAVIDGTELTLRRTAAAAALGARLLARPESRRLLVLGTGALAAPLALAHAAALDLQEIMVWGRTLAKAQAVVDALGASGVTSRATDDAQTALAACDIAVAATTATEPFIRSAWVQPGTHLGLVGAFTPAMAEAEPALLTRARLFADTREGVLQKGGEVWQALQAGLINAADIHAELAELTAPGAAAGRMRDTDITVFKSVGFAALDLIAAERVLEINTVVAQ